jgi:hypothetical protein
MENENGDTVKDSKCKIDTSTPENNKNAHQP